MTKISCEVVQDLLPLYDDGICSEQSGQLVEGHLEECEICTEFYKNMKKEVPHIETEQEDLAAARFIKKLQKKSAFAQAVMVAAALFAVIGIWYLTSQKIFWIPSEKVQISEIYELENGNLYFEIENVTARNLWFQQLEGDGKYEFHIIAGWELADINERIIPQVFETSGVNSHGQVVELEKLIYGSPEWGTEEKTIWQKGDKIKKAPKEIEEKYRQYEGFEFGYEEENVLPQNLDTDEDLYLWQEGEKH